MEIFVIGDENTVLGFSLVGIDGQPVDSLSAAQSALDQALNRRHIAIVLITEDWASQMSDRISQLKMATVQPVVMEIPAGEAEPAGPSLRELVQEAVGIRLGA